ncbi:IclR family transcriptional regulator [Paenibacillus agricola]|uniref:IclR family transcriptional regulator n=1 Tax=Paenibacillus agricola TaxID=2716264 RepID=A0ABX0J0I7_9BACL|nr:IclR family transcriptional regulator [Paenibacillus agricola]NHN28609.1 IclR family transcriptional regulator [Paenibacillus agricola]
MIHNNNRTPTHPTDKIASSTVVKAMYVLQALTVLNRNQPEGASVSEISQSSGESPSSVCKHLAAFQQFGMVEQDSQTDKYRIGTFSLLLASIVMGRMDIREIAAPYLKQLSEQAGETVHLVLLEGIHVVYIDKVESARTIRMHSQIGLRNPLYCTGVGKAILAYAPDSLVKQVSHEPFLRFTETTLYTQELLLEDLAAIRIRGYAIDNGEHEADVRCVAAPLFNHRNEPIAAISISGPEWRMKASMLTEAGQWVQSTAQEISAKLGSTSSQF